MTIKTTIVSYPIQKHLRTDYNNIKREFYNVKKINLCIYCLYNSKVLMENKILRKNEKYVITGGVPVGVPGTTNYLSVLKGI